VVEISTYIVTQFSNLFVAAGHTFSVRVLGTNDCWLHGCTLWHFGTSALNWLFYNKIIHTTVNNLVKKIYNYVLIIQQGLFILLNN